MNPLFIVSVLALLIFINGIYVAAEFSVISARRPRLAQLAGENQGLAQTILNIIESPHRLDTYVAACQLGITVSSLTLGYYGQTQFEALLAPVIGHLGAGIQVAVRSLSATLILIGLTTLQVLFGELIPKNIGLQYPERLAMFTAPPLLWSMALFRPLITIFNGSGQVVLRLLGSSAVAENMHVHSPEEILILVEESSAGGVLDAEERRLLVNTLQLRNLTARKVMIPRNHMLTAPADENCEALFHLLANSPFSRLPLYEDSIDAIVGVVHVKDLLNAHYYAAKMVNGAVRLDARLLMRPVLHIPDSAEVEEVMHKMQQEHQNLAIVVDEYGGTAGMITFEDLVEEIIGEFQDEFDIENPPLELRPNNRLRVRGDILLDDLNDAFDLNLLSEEVDTIGGLIMAELGHVPQAGEIVEVHGLSIRVDKIVHNGVAAASFPITPQQAARLTALSDQV